MLKVGLPRRRVQLPDIPEIIKIVTQPCIEIVAYFSEERLMKFDIRIIQVITYILLGISSTG